MCVSCGCNTPNDDHGDDRNITMNDLQEAGQAAGIPLEDVVRNIEEGASNQEDAEPAASGRKRNDGA
jgi:hypothetical protein